MNQQPQPGGAGGFEGGDDLEGATQMVDLNAFKNESSFGGGGVGGGVSVGGGGMQIGGDVPEGATQMVDLNAFQVGASRLDQISTSGPSYSSGGESTQFVNLADLAAGAKAAAAMPPAPAGPPPIEQDAVLLQSYQFGAQSVQHLPGDVTLIFARNSFGQEVVLKRVFNGPPEHMPQQLRDRIQALATIRHPNLAQMNGLFAAQTGCWVELQRPAGGRITHMVMHAGLTLEQAGPWFKQVADVLAQIHQRGIIYGSMTTDSIWVEPNTNAVMLEPFDVLVFEERGNLGPFGPPELNMPPEQRPIDPATDIYTLATTMIASLAGLPPTPEKLAQIPNAKLQAALTSALAQDYKTRPKTADAIIAALDGKSAGGASGGLPVDPKILGAVAALLGVVVVAFVLMSDSGGPPVAPPPDTPPETTAGNTPNETTGSTAPTMPAGVAPGVVQADARLAVTASFRLNPVVEEKKESTGADAKKADDMRVEARKLIKEASGLKEDYRQQNYTKALSNLAEAMELDPKHPDNEKLLGEVIEDKGAREFLTDAMERVEQRLEGGTVSNVVLPYRTFSKIYPGNKYPIFFEKNDRGTVTVLKRTN